MSDGISMLGWSDFVGLTRCRSVPRHQIKSRMENGLGWAVAGQSLTPFADIAPNPWGPMMEVRQIPDPTAHVYLEGPDHSSPFDLYICDSRTAKGTPWECCTRQFARNAIERLFDEYGLQFVGAFEHEFTLMDAEGNPGPPFSVEAMRVSSRFTCDLAQALTDAGLEPETIEPEYGYWQYEVTTAPATGLAAGDRAIFTREVIREVARWHGLRATFSPKPTLDGVGNGAHLHFSFSNVSGDNVTYDPTQKSQASPFAQSFIAGVLHHMLALVAYTAPSPVSYFRLGPHHWSCGFASFGIQNREAAIRICPSPAQDEGSRARGFNLELRPVDATASPYLVLGSLINAGLDGVKRDLPLPNACEVDPADLSEQERSDLGIRPLPTTLEEALTELELNETARSWMPELMRVAYQDLKKTEIELAHSSGPERTCLRYAEVY